MTSSKINQLQLLQQNLQNIALQRQQMQEQISELESALSELKTTDKAYKIVGRIMIAAGKDELLKELQSQKDLSQARLNSFIKQEEKLQENLQNLQKDVLSELKQEKTEKKGKNE